MAAAEWAARRLRRRRGEREKYNERGGCRPKPSACRMQSRGGWCSNDIYRSLSVPNMTEEACLSACLADEPCQAATFCLPGLAACGGGLGDCLLHRCEDQGGCSETKSDSVNNSCSVKACEDAVVCPEPGLGQTVLPVAGGLVVVVLLLLVVRFCRSRRQKKTDVVFVQGVVVPEEQQRADLVVAAGQPVASDPRGEVIIQSGLAVGHPVA